MAEEARLAKRSDGEESAMHARVSTYHGPAGLSDAEIEEITRKTEEAVLPGVRQMDGFKGVLSLLDQGTGKALTITLWDSADAMTASEEAANRTREQAAQIASEEIAGVERYRVTFMETG